MLQFSQSDTSVNIILTLRELISLSNPNYLFVFTHVTTKEVVAFVKLYGDDQSAFPDRYNSFNINPSALFSTPGEWHYRVYEQSSNNNTNPALAGAIIETGKMILDKAAAFAFTQYAGSTTYKTYKG